jgi:Zn-dependent protease with chaperone function
MISNPIQGQLYSAGGPTSLPVLVSLEAQQIVVYSQADQTLITQVAIDQLKVSDKLGNTPRQLTFANLDLLSLPSSTQLDQWLRSGTATKASHIFRLEKSKRAIALSMVLVPLLLVGIFRYLLPQAAITFAQYVPQAAVQVASEQTLFAMDKTILAPSALPDPVRQQYINDWTQTLAQLSLDSANYPILFRQSEVMKANAFALPDGTIVITDAMVELVKDEPDLLRAILLHEMGHVEHKHSMRLIAQSLVSAVAISYVFGDLSAFADVFTGSATTVIQNSFSQTLEWEADDYALLQLDKLGLPREHFALAMEKLQQIAGDESEIAQLLSSHPSIKARIDNARQ